MRVLGSYGVNPYTTYGENVMFGLGQSGRPPRGLVRKMFGLGQQRRAVLYEPDALAWMGGPLAGQRLRGRRRTTLPGGAPV
jgi:hypothetical protein